MLLFFCIFQMLKSNSRILNRINLKSAGCLCSMRNIMKKPVTKLPNQSTKGTKMRRYEVPPHRIGVLKSWDSRHTGELEVLRPLFLCLSIKCFKKNWYVIL